MTSRPKIIVWGKQNCPYCNQVKTYLQAHGYSYENIDVEGHDILRDVLELKYGIRTVPVTEVSRSGQYAAVFGADLEGLESLLHA